MHIVCYSISLVNVVVQEHLLANTQQDMSVIFFVNVTNLMNYRQGLHVKLYSGPTK